MQKKRLLEPIPHSHVEIKSGFWFAKTRINRETTLDFIYRHMKESGRIDAWKLDWQPGSRQPKPHIFWDSDAAKWLEAAAYSLATHPDKALELKCDTLIDLIAQAQQNDGYINIYFTAVEPQKRWSNLRDQHELYCAGHLIEAGVAYYRSTGKDKLLNIVSRYADYIISVFGPESHKKQGYPGHEEIELALIKLYRLTGNKAYLKLSKYMVDERGRQPHYFDLEAEHHGAAKQWHHQEGHSVFQAHLPVRRQRQVTGHAVRAMYLYSAMTDLAVEYSDEELQKTCEQLWHNMVDKRMYVTGGIGSSHQNEGFTRDYDLPNEAAYAETCAAIGLVFWAHRMLSYNGYSHYGDILERVLYNGVISGVSLDGNRFFYENPLKSRGTHHRKAWFDCACCPANLARLLASLGGYVAAQRGGDLFIHLFVDCRIAFSHGYVSIKTSYPWEEKIRFTLELEKPREFTLAIRLPAWCRSPRLHINGQPTPIHVKEGYLHLQHLWQVGDTIDLTLPMLIERVKAHPAVVNNQGRVALQRGPLIYCLESTDNGGNLDQIVLPPHAPLYAEKNPDLFEGITVIHGSGERQIPSMQETSLYSASPKRIEPCPITAIPYAYWDNRREGEMLVWIKETIRES
jgi:hypothetical protein